MTAFKQHYNKTTGKRLLQSCEQPLNVKDGPLFHSSYAFLDYFCEPVDKDKQAVFRVHELNEYAARWRNRNPAERLNENSWGYKHNWHSWLYVLNAGDVVAVREPEMRVRGSLCTKFDVFEVYILRAVLNSPGLRASHALICGYHIDQEKLLYPK